MFQKGSSGKSQSKRDWGAWWLAVRQARWSQPGTRLERHARALVSRERAHFRSRTENKQHGLSPRVDETVSIS